MFENMKFIEINDHYVSESRKLILFLIIMSIGMTTSSGDRETETLGLYDKKFPATLEPTKEINILKIDKIMVNVNPHKTTGTKYNKVFLAPGKHKIVIDLPRFGKGSINFLDVYVIGGRDYLVKQRVGNRKSLLSNEWAVGVWVEDAKTGEVVSKITKNI